MLDPIQKHIGYSQKWASLIIYMLDPTSCIWFSSVIPKKDQVLLCKTGPDLIWMAWSGFGQTHLVQKQVGVHESLGLVLAECKQHTASFPLSDFVALFHRQPGSYCAKPAWIRFGSGWLRQVWGERIQHVFWVTSTKCVFTIMPACLIHSLLHIQHVCWVTSTKCVLGLSVSSSICLIFSLHIRSSSFTDHQKCSRMWEHQVLTDNELPRACKIYHV